MDAPMIEFRQVTKSFNGNTVLDKVDFKIHEGEVTTIIGKSGSGKSVLLKHVIGLLKPDKGTILFYGEPIDRMKKRDWNATAARISYMFQNNALFDSMTVFENIALPLRQTTKMDKKLIQKKVWSRLEQSELAHVADKYPAQLSGGMQKRVALGRSLVTDPEIVLFDEPTTGQDPVRRNAILGMISEYQRAYGFTAVLISHDIPDVFFISNRLLILHDGGIIFQGTPEEFEDFEHPFVDEFIKSLEGLEEHLTGLYSKRSFKVRYQNMLNRNGMENRFAVILFSLEDWEGVGEKAGHTAAQKIVRSFGACLHEHFGVMGGFSSRTRTQEFVTVLPFSDTEEAGTLLEGFVQGLREKGLAGIPADAVHSGRECHEFSVAAGLAEGTPEQHMNEVLQRARAGRKGMVRFQCGIRRRSTP